MISANVSSCPLILNAFSMRREITNMVFKAILEKRKLGTKYRALKPENGAQCSSDCNLT